ncbi:hypothetical protein T484DRAFT_1786599 [Baffinella frigidus]|nr:hypothetical protein T484DRAFT_1786599 [Cryptophyta sp. CCMP2293]
MVSVTTAASYLQDLRKQREPATNCALWCNYAVHLWEASPNNASEAIEYLEKSLRVHPGYLPALCSLAAVRLDQGDTAGAKAALLRAEALAPRFPAIKEQRVRVPALHQAALALAQAGSPPEKDLLIFPTHHVPPPVKHVPPPLEPETAKRRRTSARTGGGLQEGG